MISTGAFQTEMDASNKQPTVAEKFVGVWEKKNAKAARAGGVSLMALSLAACGSDDTTTTATTTDTTTTTTTTPAVATSISKALTTDVIGVNGDTGDDFFSGSIGGTAPTIQAGDSIDGKAGSDTLTISASGTAAVTMAGVTLSGIETVRVADVTTAGTTTINLAGQSGISTLESLGSANGALLTFTNVGSIADIDLSNTSGAGTVSVAYTAATVVGTADTQVINLDNAAATGTVTVAGVESVTVNASSASTLALVATSASSITINGAAAANTIDLSSLGATKLATVTAAGSTGAQTITIDFGDDSTGSGMSVTGGSGKDVFKLSAAMGDTDSLTGGDGVDTLSMTATANTGSAAIASNKATISGVETLSLTANNDAGGASANDWTVDMDLVEGIETITLVAKDDDTANIFNLDDMNATQMGAVSLGYAAGATGATINLDAKDGSGTADSATVNITNVTGATTTVDDDNNNIDSLTLNVTSSAASAVINPDASSYTTKLTVTGGETATTSAARLIDMDAVALTSKVIDMSGVKADTTIKMGVVDTTITGGDGADKIDMVNTYTKLDTINGGAGSDTLVIKDDAHAVVAALTNVTNVEWLEITDALNQASAINLEHWGGISNVRTVAAQTAATFSGVKDGAEFEFDTTAAATITLASPNGTADTINFDLDGAGVTYTVTAANVEVLNVEANGSTGTSTLALTAAQLKTLDIDSTANQAFDTGTLGTVVQTVDLSGFTALTASNGVTMTLSTSAVNGATVTGSGNDDALNGSSQNDTINGNNGNDTINGKGGADVIDGGKGTDDIHAGNGGLDTLTGGDGADDYNVIVATTFSSAADKSTITDFNAGTSTTATDTVDITIANVNAIAVTGSFATTITNTVTGAGNANVGAGAVTAQKVTGDGAALATGTEMVFLDVGTYATDAKLKAAFAASEATFTVANNVADNDGILVVYKTGTDLNVAICQFNGTIATSDLIDGVETLVTLQGIADFTNLDGTDFIIA
jgi:hypothetical protein